ncbi:sensor histidine kinase [Streptomyces sp. NPDC047453]|uniref:sensor histidine kinase n=1 Tax=Streptomyces sp. NPDC047453 TaxID=3154812 RepID=UPI0033FC5F62
MLRRVAARLGNGPPDKTVTVDCPTDVAAAISGGRLERAVTNLIRNAQQHGHGPIAVTARQEDGQIRIEVLDHGPGFPPDLLPRAFDRFTQSDRARTTTGTGLGLAITRHRPRSRGQLRRGQPPRRRRRRLDHPPGDVDITSVDV